VTYFNQQDVESSVYVHSAPVYAVLLIGAATSKDVKIVVSSDYPEKKLLKTNFVTNNL
jgi:hypothetical protein